MSSVPPMCLICGRPCRWIGRLVILVLLVAGGLNGYVLWRGKGATDKVRDLDPAPVAIVLGAHVDADGKMSQMLADRVERAIQLWRAKKVVRILVSGARTDGHNEPNAMKGALLRAGVPGQAIFTDYQGVNTYATMVRARKQFGVRKAIVVTQGFHMARSLYLAREADLDVHGFTADIHGYGWQGHISDVREVLARVKAVISVVTDQHVPTGQRRPISGDGRGSWAP